MACALVTQAARGASMEVLLGETSRLARGAGQWQPQFERRARRASIEHAQGATMLLSQRAADVKAEPDACCSQPLRGVGADVALEDPLTLIRWNARTLIADRQRQTRRVAIVHAQPNHDVATLWTVLDGIIDKVVHDLLHAVRIAPQRHGCGRVEDDLVETCCRAEVCDNGPGERDRVALLDIEAQDALIQA